MAKKRSEKQRINSQYQSLHSKDSPSTNWERIQLVERDICLLYHQLADYSFIMGDLYYGNVYALPYWNYLDNDIALEEERKQFILNGCLVMLYAMCSEIFDGAGSYLTMDPSIFLSAKKAIDSAIAIDDETDRLLTVVRKAFELIEAGRTDWDDMDVQAVESASVWIHERFVRSYFTKRAEEFKNNPYYSSSF